MRREAVVQFLDEPQDRWGGIYATVSVLLIYGSLISIAVEEKVSAIPPMFRMGMDLLDGFTLLFFTFDLCLRLCVYRGKSLVNYLKDPLAFLVDFVAVVPNWVALLWPGFPASPAMRAFRLIRLLRLAKLFRSQSSVGFALGGLFTSLFPWLGVALGLKLFVVDFCEGEWFWFPEGGLDQPISVLGFAAALLLGAKLAIAQARYYSVEDAVCRIVGALRGIRSNAKLTPSADQVAKHFLSELQSREFSGVRSLQAMNELGRLAAEAKFDDSVICDLAKDREHVLHLVDTKTPEALDTFMRWAAYVFVGLSIVATPGITGLFATLPMVMIVGGMYVLIDDLDVPIGSEERSLINVDIGALEEHAEWVAAQQGAAGDV